MADGSEQPTLFASRALSKYERNYSQIKKEGLAIVFAVKKFHQFAFGGHFTNQTYHKLLLRLLFEERGIPSLAPARIQQWAIILSAYCYSMSYRTRSENANADFFSRYP